MSYINYARKVIYSGDYDVIVAGGGFAGITAAVASARKGMRTLLIEHYGFLGGTSTAGAVDEFWATVDGVGNVFTEISDDLRKLNKVSEDGLRFDVEYLKYVLQDVVIRNGVALRLHSRVIDVVRNGDIVEHIIVHGKSGLEALKTKIVIDATGDGDVAALAGAEFKKGRESDERQLAMSLIYTMWDTKEEQKPVLPEGCPEYKSREDTPGYGSVKREGGKLYTKTKVIGLDPTTTDGLTNAELLARQQVMSGVHYLQTHGYSTYKLVSIATQIGVREGRRIIGDYVLTEEDLVNGREFTDAIALGTANIDFHDIDSLGPNARQSRRLEKVPVYQIPYRCLLVRGIQNMLTAGKCISGTQIAQASYRQMPTCAALGQAAGTAAALAIKNNLKLRDISITELTNNLKKDGIKFRDVPIFILSKRFPWAPGVPMELRKE